MRRAEQGLADLAPLLSRMKGRCLVVVGDFVADEYVYGETQRISREAPVLIVRWERSELTPGCAGNAAMGLAALGVKVRAVGLLGADPQGKALRAALARGGVDVSGMVEVPGRATEVKTRILAGGRSTRRQQMLRVDRADPAPVPERARAALAKALARAARGAAGVLCSDYGSGAFSPPVHAALRGLAAGGLTVCADSRYHLSDFAGVTVAKPNEPELEALAGGVLRGEAALERAGKLMLRKLRTEALLVTRGRLGMALFARGRRPEHLPAHGDHEAVDVTGAGDTVIAAFAAALAGGGSYSEAAHLANVAGALAVAKPGTAVVSRDELLGALLVAR